MNHLDVPGRNLRKVSPTNSIDYLPYNSIQHAVTEGMNHITSMTKSTLMPHIASATSMQDTGGGLQEEEAIPLRPLTVAVSNGDPERTFSPYQVIDQHRGGQFLHPNHYVSRAGESNGSLGTERLSHSLPGSPADRRPNFPEVVGSAESLVGRVLVEQGLGKYCDADFVRYTSREMQEALDMTQEEMDRAAHRLLLQERQGRPLSFQMAGVGTETGVESGSGDADPHL